MEERGEDAPETIDRRMANADGEIARAGEFRYRVVNNDLDIAYRELCAILELQGCVVVEPPVDRNQPEKGT